jgi:hypothetical protein
MLVKRSACFILFPLLHQKPLTWVPEGRSAAGQNAKGGIMAWEYKIVYFCTEPLKDEGGYESRGPYA